MKVSGQVIDKQSRPSSEAASVKGHLVNIASKAGNLPDAVSATRFVMGQYSNTGASEEPQCTLYPVELGEFTGEWYVPPQADWARRNLYLHGGGWVAGAVDTHRRILDKIAAVTGRPTLAVNYRLAPEYPFPAGLTDCHKSLGWVWEHDHEKANKSKHVAVIGDSAGGNLVAATTILAIEKGSRLPTAIAMLSPVTDFRPYATAPLGLNDDICSEPGFAALAEAYLRGTSATTADPLVSPLVAVAEVLKKFPPTLVQTSSDEYLRDQAVAFASQLWNSGVVVHLSAWPQLPHAFHLFPQELTAAQRAIREVAEFLHHVDG